MCETGWGVVYEARKEGKGRVKAKSANLIPRRVASGLPSSWQKLCPPSCTLSSSPRCPSAFQTCSSEIYNTASEPRGAVLEPDCTHRYARGCALLDDHREVSCRTSDGSAIGSWLSVFQVNGISFRTRFGARLSEVELKVRLCFSLSKGRDSLV